MEVMVVLLLHSSAMVEPIALPVLDKNLSDFNRLASGGTRFSWPVKKDTLVRLSC